MISEDKDMALLDHYIKCELAYEKVNDQRDRDCLDPTMLYGEQQHRARQRLNLKRLIRKRMRQLKEGLNA